MSNWGWAAFWVVAVIAVMVALLFINHALNGQKQEAGEPLPGLTLAQSEHVRKGYPL